VGVCKVGQRWALQRLNRGFAYKRTTKNHIYLCYSIFLEDELLRKIPVTLKVKKTVFVPAAKRDILKGKKISKEDIYFLKKRGNLKERSFKEIDIVGKVAKRDIKKDSIIKEYFLEPNFIVFKQKKVKIVYKKGAIKIELVGIALENGVKNQIIRVKNISTNRIIKCKVVSALTVEFIQ